MQRNRYIFSGFILVVVLATLVNAQLFTRDRSDEFLRGEAGKSFMQVYSTLKSSYLDEVDDTAIVEGAIKGMIAALEDSYTTYSEADIAEAERENLAGSFGGIGVTLAARDRLEDKIIEVINVFRDGPAWNAGVQRGDIFYEVDGVNVENFTSREIINIVRGIKGTPVELGFKRPGEAEVQYFTIVRDTIDIIVVESTMLKDNIGYIKITTFGNQRVHEDLVQKIQELEQAGARGLILDLRNNLGGLLTQGIKVADEFLDSGDIVFQRVRGITQRIAAADPHMNDIPLVVIVNSYSASASEIVAGALQDNQRALVVGEKTFGKGVGQSVQPLANGAQLTYTSFEWLTPDRSSIHEEGISPDIESVDDVQTLISLEGQGAQEGQEITFSVEGESLGAATADEEGNFSFVQFRERSEMSEVPGEALVVFETDMTLQKAYDVLDQQLRQAGL